MYYPSEWDAEKAAAVVEELKDEENVELFNNLALCYVQGLYCELLSDVTPDDIKWIVGLNANVTAITNKWDMEGELVQDFGQVTELASYLMKVEMYKGYVDFGFDKDFSSSNPVSQ